MRIWVTDGSPAPFSDVDILSAVHPGPMGGNIPYKGAIDTAVAVGNVELSIASGDLFVPEAEWCVLFPEGAEHLLANPESIRPDTEVTMQGMIEGKWLNRLLGPLQWKAASIGNNLLALGPGIVTTLGAITGGIEGEILITYNSASGGRSQSASLADLAAHNIDGLVRAVIERCRQTATSVEGVNCSARGARAALADDPAFLQRALVRSGLGPGDLRTEQGWKGVIAAAIDIVREEGLAVLPSSQVTIEVQRGRSQVGRGTLTLAPSH